MKLTKFITILIAIIASIGTSSAADYSARLQAKLIELRSANKKVGCEGMHLKSGEIVCVPINGHIDGGRAFELAIVSTDTDRATTYLTDVITGESLQMTHGLRFTTALDGSAMYAGMFTISTQPAAEMFAATVGGRTSVQEYAVFTWGEGAGFEKPGTSTDTMPIIGVNSVELVMGAGKKASLTVKQAQGVTYKVMWSSDLLTWKEASSNPVDSAPNNGVITRTISFTGTTATELAASNKAFFKLVP